MISSARFISSATAIIYTKYWPSAGIACTAKHNSSVKYVSASVWGDGGGEDGGGAGCTMFTLTGTSFVPQN